MPITRLQASVAPAEMVTSISDSISTLQKTLEPRHMGSIRDKKIFNNTCEAYEDPEKHLAASLKKARQKAVDHFQKSITDYSVLVFGHSPEGHFGPHSMQSFVDQIREFFKDFSTKYLSIANRSQVHELNTKLKSEISSLGKTFKQAKILRSNKTWILDIQIECNQILKAHNTYGPKDCILLFPKDGSKEQRLSNSDTLSLHFTYTDSESPIQITHVKAELSSKQSSQTPKDRQSGGRARKEARKNKQAFGYSQ